MTKFYGYTTADLAAAYLKHGSLKAVARAWDIPWGNIQRLYAKAKKEGTMVQTKVGRKRREEVVSPVDLSKPTGRVRARKTHVLPLPSEGEVKRYLLTSAQNATHVHWGFWLNLLVLAKHYNAEVHVSRFTYNKWGLGAAGDKSSFQTKRDAGDDMWWDAEFTPYLSDERLQLAPGLLWCGEVNISPTAQRPLSGFEVYTGRESGIFPHPRIAMESVPSSRHEPTKFNYTTGTATQRNYIQRATGLKADFHHSFGAILVEVNSKGSWWVRQVSANDVGTICDLDVMVKKEVLTTGNRVEGITWGDVHVADVHKGTFHQQWGALKCDSMIDALRPKHQFLHDVIDFRSASHHELKDPHKRFQRYIQGMVNVREEVRDVGTFLSLAMRPWCQTHIVDSNHHHHIGRWLREFDGRVDPSNVEFWLELQSKVYDRLRHGDNNPLYLRLALDIVHPEGAQRWMHWIGTDESYVLKGIEQGAHGHAGPNGARGNPRSLARIGRKQNQGHTHTAGIYDGNYVAGTSGPTFPDYGEGPSSWSNSHILTYKNGKRAIVTIWQGQWAAGRGRPTLRLRTEEPDTFGNFARFYRMGQAMQRQGIENMRKEAA